MPNESFTRSGDGWFQFAVPAGVKTLNNVEIRGGGSQATGTDLSVQAGLITGAIDVKDSDVLIMYLGQAGKDTSGNAGGAGGAAGVRSGAGTVVQAGGDGGAGANGSNRGGNGGGSATAVWLRDTSKPGGLGRLLAVAGGAGGSSGDDGKGGLGGGTNGGDGQKGTGNNGAGGFTAATGGRQNQGGKGGISGFSNAYNGGNAGSAQLGKGGTGKTANPVSNYGGGGGGGGFYAGGGQAVANSEAPGGGGAGGSSYTGGMNSGVKSLQGSGGVGDGSVKFFWQNSDTNRAPTAPTETKVNGRAETPGMSAGSLDTAEITAKAFDTDGDKVRLYAKWSTNSNFNNTRDKQGALVEVKNDPVKVAVTLNGLKAGTHYWVRLWSQDEKGLKSINYRAVDFWTNRIPTAPALKQPPNYMQFPNTATLTFTWTYNDADGSHQTAFALRYRIAGTPTNDPRPWHWVGGSKKRVISEATSWTIAGTTFKANYTYEWQVRTRDTFNKWSPWSGSRTFSTNASTSAPELIHPANGGSIEADVDHTFTWRHVNWRTGQVQYSADVQIRVHNEQILDDDAVWTLFPGDAQVPGAATERLIPAEYDDGSGLQQTFIAGLSYDWQVRTYSGFDFSNPSQWSDSHTFFVVPAAGSGLEPDNPVIQIAAGPLGCGNNRVLVAERGGNRIIGEITELASVQWTRVRDDISSCNISSVEFGDDCGALLASLRSWQHELVVYRDGERVWEGPIVRIAYFSDHVEVEAKDVMTYVYRRVMRVGYNDTYLLIHGVKVNSNGRSVVERAVMITQNALGYDDPNVLPYLTRIDASDDAHEARTIAAFQKTAWEEIDDLAATAGLDYTVAGRRIIYNDVHNPIGKLPVMRTGDFSQDPVVTEYGMAMANVFFVSSEKGQWGVAYPTPISTGGGASGQEMLSSDQQTMNSPTPVYAWNTGFGAFDIGGPITRSTDRADTGTYSLKCSYPPLAKPTENLTLVDGFTIGSTYVFSARVWIPTGAPNVMCDAIYAGAGQWATERDRWVSISTTFVAFSDFMWLGFQTPPSTTGGLYYVDTASLKVRADGAFQDDDHEEPLYYPFVEMLASAYGESADDPRATVTADKKMSVSQKLANQAALSITNRWPSPVMVRVPDNSLLSPELQIGINQLIPGVWVPLQATNTLRQVTQWQKLESVTVTQTGDTPEQIAVVMSPAPSNREEDPDDGSSSLDDGESV